jgi:hypothetical protein
VLPSFELVGHIANDMWCQRALAQGPR